MYIYMYFNYVLSNHLLLVVLFTVYFGIFRVLYVYVSLRRVFIVTLIFIYFCFVLFYFVAQHC